VLELLWLLLTTVLAWLRPRQDLVLENLLLRHQLAVLTRPTRTRPRARLRAWDKLLWILARRFCTGRREYLAFVTPETVVRWHRQGWRLVWRWKSRSRGGRPKLSPEVQDLIRTMSRENRLWGTERIRGELLKLGIVVSNRSIRRYRWRGPGRPPRQTWRTFLANHAHHLWAADLFTVPTLTFKTLYVLVFIAHGRRELVHVNVTANPTAAWVWRQVIEATPGVASRGICCAIEMPSMVAISASAPDGSAWMPSPHPCIRPVRTRLLNVSLGPSAANAWTTSSGRCSPDSSATTTRNGSIARSDSRRPSRGYARRPVRSGHGRC
jgi:hypothetical protein